MEAGKVDWRLKQKKQVPRLRFASLGMTIQGRLAAEAEKAGPSTALCFARDDNSRKIGG
jgi:hypothetical protein